MATTSGGQQMASITYAERDVLEQLLADICHQAFKHEVQTWKDAPGTDAEKLKAIVPMAREALAIIRGKHKPVVQDATTTNYGKYGSNPNYR